jgi:hypothetical protein
VRPELELITTEGLDKLRKKLPTAADPHSKQGKELWKKIHDFLNDLEVSIQVFLSS